MVALARLCQQVKKKKHRLTSTGQGGPGQAAQEKDTSGIWTHILVYHFSAPAIPGALWDGLLPGTGLLRDRLTSSVICNSLMLYMQHMYSV